MTNVKFQPCRKERDKDGRPESIEHLTGPERASILHFRYTRKVCRF